MEYELYHYGRKGMKWYQRIFSRDKEKAAARKAAKEVESEEKRKARIESTKKKVRASRSAEELYKYASLFDDKELQAAYQRLLTEKQIKDLIPDKKGKGKKFVDSVGANAKSLDTAIKNTTSLYDTVKGVFERFSNSDTSSHEKATKVTPQTTALAKRMVNGAAKNTINFARNNQGKIESGTNFVSSFLRLPTPDDLE